MYNQQYNSTISPVKRVKACPASHQSPLWCSLNSLYFVNRFEVISTSEYDVNRHLSRVNPVKVGRVERCARLHIFPILWTQLVFQGQDYLEVHNGGQLSLLRNEGLEWSNGKCGVRMVKQEMKGQSCKGGFENEIGSIQKCDKLM